MHREQKKRAVVQDEAEITDGVSPKRKKVYGLSIFYFYHLVTLDFLCRC